MNLVLPNIDEYQKESGLYVHYDREWEIEKYGYETKSKWDVIFITCAKILQEGDRSVWAIRAIHYCWHALFQGRRWPWWLDDENDCKTRQEKRHWEGEYEPYGPVTKLTRDSYIYLNTATILMGLNLPILTPPWYLNYAPTTYFWCKYLDTQKPVYKRLYLAFENRSHPKKEYVKNLQKCRLAAYEHLNRMR